MTGPRLSLMTDRELAQLFRSVRTSPHELAKVYKEMACRGLTKPKLPGCGYPKEWRKRISDYPVGQKTPQRFFGF